MTSTPSKKFNPNDYVPKRFALNFTPPFIILEYLVPSTGKLYHHKMRLHKFSAERSSQDMFNQIYMKHNMYLDKKIIKHSQMISLIDKIKEKRKSNEKSPEQSSEEVKVKIDKKDNNIYKGSNYDELEYDSDEFENEVFEDEDLNKLDDDELNAKKEKMDVFFRKNNLKEGDEGYQYDVRKDFKQDEYAAEWDESF
jgi:centrosomal protein CEP19